MTVLRVSKDDPSSSCVAALDEMHSSDQDLQQLTGAMQNDNETTPVLDHQSSEMGVGRDVLASDIVATANACRHDADLRCMNASSGDVMQACAKLKTSETRTTP